MISKIKLKHKDETKQYLLKNYENNLKIKPKNYIESSNTVIKWLSIYVPPYPQLCTVLEALCDTSCLAIRPIRERL